MMLLLRSVRTEFNLKGTVDTSSYIASENIEAGTFAREK